MDEQCEFLHRMDVEALFQQINFRYEWDVDTIFFSFNYSSSLLHFRISCKDSPPRLLRMFLRPPTKFRQSLSNFSAIPCELFGNTLRALFLKSRDFFWYCEIFLPNTRGPLRCLLYKEIFNLPLYLCGFDEYVDKAITRCHGRLISN